MKKAYRLGYSALVIAGLACGCGKIEMAESDRATAAGNAAADNAPTVPVGMAPTGELTLVDAGAHSVEVGVDEPQPAPEADSGAAQTPSAPAAAAGVCCSATGGCADHAVEACVCAADPGCCSGEWDAVCVTLVAALGCGTCKSDCCVSSAVPGCADPEVERCVCDKSSECCTSGWDEFCVVLASAQTASGTCGGQCQ